MGSANQNIRVNAKGLQRAVTVLRHADKLAAQEVIKRLPESLSKMILDRMPANKPRSPIDSDTQPTGASACVDSNPDADFQFLEDVRQATLFAAILRERPQVIAAILAVVPTQYAPRIVRALSETRRLQIVRLLTELEPIDQTTAAELATALKARVQSVADRQNNNKTGVQRVVGILQQCERSTEWEMLRSLGRDNPGLTERIQDMMLDFEKIGELSNREIQAIIRHVSTEQWAVAFKRASEALRQRVETNLSPRSAQRLRAEMDYFGDPMPSEIDQAQQQIVDVARKLAESGQISRAA